MNVSHGELTYRHIQEMETQESCLYQRRKINEIEEDINVSPRPHPTMDSPKSFSRGWVFSDFDPIDKARIETERQQVRCLWLLDSPSVEYEGTSSCVHLVY